MFTQLQQGQTVSTLKCVDFWESSLTELNTGAQVVRGGGTTRTLITIIKFFQIYEEPKAGKIQKTETPNSLFCVLLRQCTPPHFIFIRQPVPFFPTAIFTVGENEDGEAGGRLYPPLPFTLTCE